MQSPHISLYPGVDYYYHPVHPTTKATQASSNHNEKLLERVHRMSKVINELRNKLAMEKELLQREKLMSASMFLIPTSNEYYTLAYPTSASDTTNIYHAQLNSELGYDTHLESQSGDEYGICPENNLMSHTHAYRKHLKSVENKCNVELGAVKDSICNLKRVSTELHLEMANEERFSRGERRRGFTEDVY